jgi:dolichyl-phosphate-mannose--protein O-mannosyl transferase
MNSASPTPSSRAEHLLVLTCLGMVLVGVGARFIDLGSPPGFTFDEHHFIPNARNYLAHQADWNDHPPLSKLLLIPGMLALGDQAWGWRLSSALLGTLLVLLVGVVAGRLFQSRLVGLLAAAFVALDGLFIAYARTVLPDTPLWTFVFGALAVLLGARRGRSVVAAGLLLGLAIATKWTGVCLLLATPWLLWRQGLSRWHLVTLGVSTVATYLGVWCFGLWQTGQSLAPASIWAAHKSLLAHHAGFTVWDNPANSRWYTWPALWHPLVMAFEKPSPGVVRCTSMVGNPWLWYAAGLGALLTVGFIARRVRQAVTLRTGSLLPPEVRAPLGALGLMLLFVAPFVFSNRQAYFFHAMGSAAVGYTLLAWGLERALKHRRGWLLGFVGVALLVGLFYLPVWTFRPEPTWLWELQLPVQRWR